MKRAWGVYFGSTSFMRGILRGHWIVLLDGHGVDLFSLHTYCSSTSMSMARGKWMFVGQGKSFAEKIDRGALGEGRQGKAEKTQQRDMAFLPHAVETLTGMQTPRLCRARLTPPRPVLGGTCPVPASPLRQLGLDWDRRRSCKANRDGTGRLY